MQISVFALLTRVWLAAFAVQGGFWSPVLPPRAKYQIDAMFDTTAAVLTGRETVSFRNTTSRPIDRLALDWNLTVNEQTVTVTANGQAARLLVPPDEKSVRGPLLVELPNPLQPNDELVLKMDFRNSYRSDPDRDRGLLLQGWHPKLWWGFGTHDDYLVHLKVPSGWQVVSSGVWDAASSVWRGKDIRDFALGILNEKQYVVEHARAGDVDVTVVHTEAGRKCAELVLQTAVDVIGFYRERFGFYPQQSLTIMPGGDDPVGGYPAATAMVVIHGEERMEKKPEAHFRWITAHEIGHMYWSQQVLAEGQDDLDWLMIGLGIFADREYRRARKILPPVGNLPARYVEGMKEGLDTTIDVTSEQEELIEWDFNNVVEHGKSSAMIDALEATIGAQPFDRAYRRSLQEFRGRRMNWRDFQRVCEDQSGEDLGWFFESWVRSNQHASYQVVTRNSKKSGNGWRSEVEVIAHGSLLERVPIVATFEDGSQQTQTTDRLAKVSGLSFESKSPLQQAVVDPQDALWTLDSEAPLAVGDLERKILHMSVTGTGEQALVLLPRAREVRMSLSRPWRRLGLMLFDGKHYAESLECFQAAMQSASDPDYRFLALIWQGHLLDLLGRREAALEAYKAAQATNSQAVFRFDQYKMQIDQAWVQQRLQQPFTRE